MIGQCQAIAFLCICTKPDNHHGPHECRCGGQWLGQFDGLDFEVVRLPGASPYAHTQTIIDVTPDTGFGQVSRDGPVLELRPAESTPPARPV